MTTRTIRRQVSTLISTRTIPLVSTLLAVAVGYLITTLPAEFLGPLFGFIFWALIAIRWPIIALSILAAGQFLLRAVIGGFGDLSRASDTPLVLGVVLLLPLAVGVLVRGDLSRLRTIWRYQGTLILALTVLSAAVLLSYVTRPSGYGELKVLAYLGLNLPLFFASLLLLRGHREARLMLIAAIAVSTVTLIVSLAGSVGVWNEAAIRGTAEFTGQLGSEPVDIGVWFARRVAIGGLAALAILMVTRPGVAWLYSVSAVSLLAGVVLAASLSPVIGLALATLAMFLIPGARRYGGRKVAIVGVIAAAIILALSYLPPQFADRYLNTFNPDNPSLQVRLSEWDQTVSLIGANPLMGVGVGRYPIEILGIDHVIYPHNLVLEFAVELGVPIAVAFLVFVAASFRHGWIALRRLRQPWSLALAMWGFAVLLLSFVSALSSGDLRTNEHIWMAAGVLAAVSLIAQRRESEYSGSPPETVQLPRLHQQDTK